MSEQINNTVNFDENGEFSSLDDILLALNKSRYCYSACVALRSKKDKYSSDRTRIIEQLIREIEHTITQILLYSNKKLKNNGKVMQFNDYQSIY